MTEEEFKKAMTKTIIFIVVMIIILIVVAFLVFNKSGKSTSIFKNDGEKANYKKSVEDLNTPNISDEDIEQISGNEEIPSSNENQSQESDVNSNTENQEQENSETQNQ